MEEVLAKSKVDDFGLKITDIDEGSMIKLQPIINSIISKGMVEDWQRNKGRWMPCLLIFLTLRKKLFYPF